jgi:hypothetical protein
MSISEIDDFYNINCKNVSIGFFQNVINDLKRQLEGKKKKNENLINEYNSIGMNYFQLSENKLKLLEENSSLKSQMGFLKNEINIKKKYLDNILSTFDNNEQLNLSKNVKGKNEKVMNLLNELQNSINESNELIEKKMNQINLIKFIELPKDIKNNLSIIMK